MTTSHSYFGQIHKIYLEEGQANVYVPFVVQRSSLHCECFRALVLPLVRTLPADGVNWTVSLVSFVVTKYDKVSCHQSSRIIKYWPLHRWVCNRTRRSLHNCKLHLYLMFKLNTDSCWAYRSFLHQIMSTKQETKGHLYDSSLFYPALILY